MQKSSMFSALSVWLITVQLCSLEELTSTEREKKGSVLTKTKPSRSAFCVGARLSETGKIICMSKRDRV